ncbi:MAG: ABC transporter permease, partial [Lachnospiraceae bacterium]|nr:ABC transporter permease [Lachnospiraceae bacterium]
MAKYIVQRLIKGILSAVCVVVLIMILVYSLMDRGNIFSGDSNYTKTQSNARITYEQSRYQAFGYVDYVNYSDYINTLVKRGDLDEENRSAAALIGQTPEKDSETAAEYIQMFTQEYESQGYTIVRLDADKKTNGRVKDGGQAALFATRDKPLYTRVISYFTGMFFIDNIHYVDE